MGHHSITRDRESMVIGTKSAYYPDLNDFVKVKLNTKKEKARHKTRIPSPWLLSFYRQTVYDITRSRNVSKLFYAKEIDSCLCLMFLRLVWVRLHCELKHSPCECKTIMFEDTYFLCSSVLENRSWSTSIMDSKSICSLPISSSIFLTDEIFSVSMSMFCLHLRSANVILWSFINLILTLRKTSYNNINVRKRNCRQ